MYIPKHFEVTDDKEIYAFIELNGFGQLISIFEGRLFSTHIPFILSEDRAKLLGHLASKNPQVNDIDGQEVLVTLQGAHDYISPSWYEGSGVPTWSYQAVHIYGRCKVFSDPKKLKLAVDMLTEKYESRFSEPWNPDYNSSMLGAIIGLEIDINEIQCKYKLSQNRSEQDQKQVIEQLKINGSLQLSEVMNGECG